MQRIRVLSAAIAAIVAMCVTTATADASVKQMQLAEKQVLAFVAAQQVMRGILESLLEEEQDNPPPAVQAQLEETPRSKGSKTSRKTTTLSSISFWYGPPSIRRPRLSPNPR